MRMTIGAAAVAFGALAAPASAAKVCDCETAPCVALENDVALSGVLVVRKQAFMLKLDRKTCFKGTGEGDHEDSVDIPGEDLLHVAPDEPDAARLRGLVGKRLTLTGGAHGRSTRYHLTPVVFSLRTSSEAR